MKLFFKFSLLIFACVFFSVELSAQDISVKSVSKAKKTVTIKSGKNDGITKGSSICFYEGTKKITCGKVRKAGKRASIVKVRKSKIGKISSESIARINTKSSTKRRRKKRRRRNTFRTNVKVAYSYMFLSPTTYNTPFYKHLTKIDDETGLVVSAEKTGPFTSPYGMIRNRPRQSIGDSVLGGGLEFEFAFSKKMSLSIGGRYNYSNDVTGRFSVAEGPSGKFNDSGYENDFPATSYIDITTSSSSFGAWLDFNFFGLRLGRSMLLKFGAGIDAEFNSLNISGTSSLPALPDKEKLSDIANNGQMSVILSGRLPIDFSYNMKSFGFGFKVIPMFAFLPIELSSGENIINGPALDPTITGPLADPSVRAQWEDAFFKEDLEYGAGGFSLEIQPIYFAFYF